MSEGEAPAVIRISRPHATEDALLEHEAHTLSKSGILLLSAAPQIVGSIHRFEVTLSTGASALRGEGRVTGVVTFGGETGVALRFTRLDTRTKALVDRAVAIREARAAASGVPLPKPAPSSTSVVSSALVASEDPGREAALARLRERAERLSEEDVSRILAASPRR